MWQRGRERALATATADPARWLDSSERRTRRRQPHGLAALSGHQWNARGELSRRTQFSPGTEAPGALIPPG